MVCTGAHLVLATTTTTALVDGVSVISPFCKAKVHRWPWHLTPYHLSYSLSILPCVNHTFSWEKTLRYVQKILFYKYSFIHSQYIFICIQCSEEQVR